MTVLGRSIVSRPVSTMSDLLLNEGGETRLSDIDKVRLVLDTPHSSSKISRLQSTTRGYGSVCRPYRPR